ncbi:helix-turn-helix domain-containing protein [Streptomyces sp. NPDC046866]|uniref:helix-turn-helix domain-containing protein n=1 Tax=Streptomyces sp. NPDC046866 TaxID=3154921 RepID=UPI003452E6DE
MRARIGEPLSPAQATRAPGVSERTLQRAVTRTSGCSPVRLVQDLRVEQAEHLLRTTARPPAAAVARRGHSARSLRG